MTLRYIINEYFQSWLNGPSYTYWGKNIFVLQMYVCARICTYVHVHTCKQHKLIKVVCMYITS